MKFEQSNVNPDEIKKFDALASKWWDLNGEFNALHRINPIRLDYIMDKSQGVSGKQILDVGCGGGILSESLAKMGAQVTGLDLAQDALTVAKQHAQHQDLSIHYRLEPVEHHAEKFENSYDIVTCMEMLEHVPDPAAIVAACVKLVKPGGHLFFATINRNFKAWLLLIAGAELITRMVPKGTHDPKKFIRPSELCQWLEQHPVDIADMAGIHYHLFKDTFQLSHQVDTNYMLHAVKKAST